MKQIINLDNTKHTNVTPVISENNNDLHQNYLRLIICDNTVFIPTMVLSSKKKYVMAGPVHEEKIDEPDLLHRIELERKTRAIILTEDQAVEIQKVDSQQLLLDATGFTSKQELDTLSAYYSIFWDNVQEKIVLSLNEPDLTKPSQKLLFDYQTDILVLVTTILRDLQKYPEVFKEKDPAAFSNIPKSSTVEFSETIKKSMASQQNVSPTKITVSKLTERSKQVKNNGVASIVIKNGKAFIPSNAKDFDHGVGFWVDPIYECDLVADDLVKIVSKVLDQDAVAISTEEGKNLIELGKKGKSPLLVATKSTSWRDLEKTSLNYSIQSFDNGTKWVLFLHSLKKENSEGIYFQMTTPLEELIDLILKDIHKYI